jgi:hypothetical protein
MKDALVKLTIDLYAPEARLSTREHEWLKKWDQFPTRRILFPVEPLEYLTKVADAVSELTVVKDFCHLRLTTMDDSYEGLLDSELDHVLTNVRLDYFLGDELFKIAHDALVTSPPFNQFRAHVAWCEIWTFDEEHLLQRREVSIDRLISVVRNETP